MRRLSIAIIVTVFLLSVTTVLAAPPKQDVSGQGNLADDVFRVTCDTGEEILGGTIFTFLAINPGFSYRVTTIGIGEFDPVMAVITGPGIGNCNDDNTSVAGSQVAVPGVGLIEGDNLDSQVTVSTSVSGNVDVVVGGYQGATGQFAMVVEGLAINPRDELDGFLISVPTVLINEPIGVYMVNRSGSRVDPYLQLAGGHGLQQDPLDFNQAQILMICDDAGVGDCSNTEQFPGGGVDITNGFRYEADTNDAGISIALGSTDKFLYAFGSYNSETTGDYAIIVVGTVPGSLDEKPATGTTMMGANNPGSTGNTTGASTGATCNNVATSIVGVSSQYDNTYAPENLLDNNPQTSWSTSGITDTEYFMVGFNQVYTISQVRLNGYAATQGFQNDSVQNFVIGYIGADNNAVRILEATAPLQAGYQTYTFAPVQVDHLMFALVSNYGGSNFEISDVMVCAQ